jgi:hypothetical protein
MQAVRAAEEVARYRRAQLSAIKLAGDINAKVTDSVSLDELIAKLKGELHKLAPIIDLDVAREPQGREPRAALQGLEPGRLSLSGRCCACRARWCGFEVEDLLPDRPPALTHGRPRQGGWGGREARASVASHDRHHRTRGCGTLLTESSRGRLADPRG